MGEQIDHIIEDEEKQYELKEILAAGREAMMENNLMAKAIPILESHAMSTLFSYRYAFMLGYQEAIKEVKALLP